MGRAKVIGTRDADFKIDGNRICGLNVYISRKADGVIGEMTDKIFINSTSQVKVPVFKIGHEYDFIYDGFGRFQTLGDIKEVIWFLNFLIQINFLI